MDKIMKLSEKIFRLNENAWKRHSNPWSVITRYICLPLYVLFPYLYQKSIITLTSMILWLAVALIWTWINPRAFPPPKTTKSWLSKCVLGERVYLNRKNIPIPKHYEIAPKLVSVASLLGLVLIIIGFSKYKGDYLVFGIGLVIIGKTWFLDRMVFLFDDMKKHEEYSSLEY